MVFVMIFFHTILVDNDNTWTSYLKQNIFELENMKFENIKSLIALKRDCLP